MLRYKRIIIPVVTDGKETILEILSCPQGKSYRIVSISTAPLSLHYLRVYRDAEQIVDAATIIMTTSAPILPMDIPLSTGQVCKAGFYNDGASEAAKPITIGYKDD